MRQQGAVRTTVLGLLGTLVLTAHVLLLGALPGPAGPAGAHAARAFTVRSVAVPAPLQQAVAPTAAPLPAEPRPPRAMAKAAPSHQAPAATPPLASPQAHEPATLLAAQSAAPEPKTGPAQRPAAPAAVLRVADSVRLLYDVAGEAKGFPYRAHSELLWQQDGQKYDARLEVKVFLLGSRSQTSTGRITADGVAPNRFADKARSEQAAHFERDQGRIVFSANTPSAALLPGAQDRVSVMFQLAAMFAGEAQRYPAGSDIAVPTVGPRDAEVWHFTVGETETLKLPGGSLPGLRLTRQPRSAYDQRLELWLAPGMGYLPVRLRMSQDNGDFVDQQWRASAPP